MDFRQQRVQSCGAEELMPVPPVAQFINEYCGKKGPVKQTKTCKIRAMQVFLSRQVESWSVSDESSGIVLDDVD